MHVYFWVDFKQLCNLLNVVVLVAISTIHYEITKQNLNFSTELVYHYAVWTLSNNWVDVEYFKQQSPACNSFQVFTRSHTKQILFLIKFQPKVDQKTYFLVNMLGYVKFRRARRTSNCFKNIVLENLQSYLIIHISNTVTSRVNFWQNKNLYLHIFS